ncbi:MAG: LacI family DNA-binding transcriptional regulator [Anaerolineae bacterium]|nr:LacI family DNA-binding transcriptional regulator [Anaerolineae bacterium]
MKRDNRPAPVTIFDVAKAAGVSISTVSRVVNNNGRISEQTRARVTAQMEALGYIPNEHARRLAGTTHTGVIGLLVHALGTEYIGEIIRGIEEQLEHDDYDLIVHTTHRHKGREADYVSTITQRHADGLLLVVPIGHEEYLDRLNQLHFPYVLVDVDVPIPSTSSSVGTTNRLGAYEATRHLLELEHRRIAFVTDTPNISSSGQRLKGYQEALQEFGVPFDPQLVQEDNFNKPDPRLLIEKLLALKNAPTAILASSDLIAFRIQEILGEAGLQVPQDVSVVGVDDILQASLEYRKLTTVHQPLYEMGKEAARMLLALIEDPELQPQRVQLQTRLVIRGSTAQRRQS